jgi:hypothetical protein
VVALLLAAAMVATVVPVSLFFDTLILIPPQQPLQARQPSLLPADTESINLPDQAPLLSEAGMEESVEVRVAVHEAVCAQRYEAIEKRLDDGSKRMSRIEIWLYITLGAVLLGPGAMADVVKKLLGL